MKAVAGVQQADQYCHHLCANPLCGCVFPDLDKSDWEAHKDQCCLECGMRRFKHVSGRLAPRKRLVSPSPASPCGQAPRSLCPHTALDSAAVLHLSCYCQCIWCE